MVGMDGLWKMLTMVRALPVDFRRSFPSTTSQPPRYFSWSSQSVGKPVPGFVSTLFHHMYSVPRRSVQMFLQAMLHVWHPMHLSRWNTMAICERTFIPVLLPSPPELRKLADEDVGVAVAARRAPVVEVEGELPAAADHQVRLQAGPRQAVVAARPAMAA